MLLALGTALLLVGTTCAQAPQAEPAAAPPLTPMPVLSEEPPGPTHWWGGAPAAPGGQFWAEADYVVGWFSGDRLPVLVTASPAGTARNVAGVGGVGTTAELFGGGIVNDDARSGIHLGGGYWFCPEHTFGIEAGGLLLESQASLFDASSNGTPFLARPFINATTGLPQAFLIASPGISSGSIGARAASGDFYEAHIDLRENVVDWGWLRLDSLLGYRFYRYDEGLSIAQSRTNILNTRTGTVFASEDDFNTQNEFHGADMGFRTQLWWENFSLDLLTKCGVGSVNRTVKVLGETVTTIPGSPTLVREGGLYALASNIGSAQGHDWTVLPELGATLGWQASHNVRVTLSYSLLWLDRIARAADQVDQVINPALIPPATGTVTSGSRPAFVLDRADTWLQTLSLGVEFSY
ncbi:MAG TPA: BBP7 family outer membrane beta-barrel protein [Gemmataceae bacterium]|nr:BBP7 family outer membrane beta-barrel protein [Gemmataceae bacterium]